MAPPKTINLAGSEDDPPLRPRTPAAKPRPTGATTPPAAGARLPVLPKPGQVIMPDDMLPIERDALAKLNWPKGEAVPGNLSEIAAAAGVDLDELPPPVPIDTPPVKVGATVDIENVPAEKRAEVLEAARDSVESIRAAEASARKNRRLQSLPDSVRAATMQLQVENMPQSRKPTAKQIEEPEEKPSPEEPEAPFSKMDEHDHQTFVPEADEPLPDKAAAKGRWLTHCPLCQWPLKEDSGLKPTEHDYQVFTQAMLGGLQFEKEYAMYGGKLSFTFRTLSVREEDAIAQQVMQDGVDGLVTSPEQAMGHVMRYRLALQLVRFNAEEMPSDLSHWKVGAAQATPRQIFNHLEKSHIKSSTLYSTMSMFLNQFNLLTRRLMGDAAKEGFTDAITSAG